MVANTGHGLHASCPYRGTPDRARTYKKATVISVDYKAPLAIEKKRKEKTTPFKVILAAQVHLLYCMAR